MGLRDWDWRSELAERAQSRLVQDREPRRVSAPLQATVAACRRDRVARLEALKRSVTPGQTPAEVRMLHAACSRCGRCDMAPKRRI